MRLLCCLVMIGSCAYGESFVKERTKKTAPKCDETEQWGTIAMTCGDILKEVVEIQQNAFVHIEQSMRGTKLEQGKAGPLLEKVQRCKSALATQP